MAKENIVDLTNLADDLRKAGDKSGDSIQRLLEFAANEIAAEGQNLAPVRTGKLRDSISVTSATGRVYVGPDIRKAPYASFVEYGTGARGEFPTGEYEIRPKTAKVLRFTMHGKTIFTKKVTHPGIKAHPYMRPAVVKWLSTLGEKAADVGVDLIMGKDKDVNQLLS